MSPSIHRVWAESAVTLVEGDFIYTHTCCLSCLKHLLFGSLAVSDESHIRAQYIPEENSPALAAVALQHPSARVSTVLPSGSEPARISRDVPLGAVLPTAYSVFRAPLPPAVEELIQGPKILARRVG